MMATTSCRTPAGRRSGGASRPGRGAERPHALITGASQGLGRALAEECARCGKSLILVSLASSGLEEAGGRIARSFGVGVHCRELDLTASEAPERLYGWVREQGLAVDLLINNAGIGFSGSFESSALATNESIINLNILAGCPAQQAVITHPAVLEAMIRILRSAGAAVSYGDSSGIVKSAQAARDSGLAAVATRHGVCAGDFEHAGSATSGGRRFPIARAVLEAEAVFNLAKMKTHQLTRITGAVKNLFGCARCGLCLKACPLPEKALRIRRTDRLPVYDYQRCIRCYCCQEICPQRAIHRAVPFLGRLLPAGSSGC